MTWLANLVTRHWRGELPVLGGVIFLLFGLHVLAFGLAGALPAERVPVLAGLAVALPSLLVWQVVGVFRAIDRAIRDGGALVPAFAGYLAIAAVLVSALFQLVGLGLAPRTVPGPSAAVPAAVPDPAGVRAVGETILLEGEITLGGYGALERLLQQGSGLRRVVLRSQGGNIPAARGMARLIETAGLDTEAAGDCYSACTLVFMAGARRAMRPGAALGFHGYRLVGDEYLGRGGYLDLHEEEARDRAFYRRRGVADDFVARVHLVSPDRIWRPSRELLRAAGVLTE